jgi:hypothetical protein
MAAISDATTATSAVHHINSELILAVAAKAVQRPYVWRACTHAISLIGANTANYAHPIFAQLSAAAAHTETDEVASAEITRVQATISTAEYAKATFLGDRAQRLSIADEQMMAADRLADACMLKMETDVLTLAASMTNTQGDNATVNNVANFNSVLANFRVQIGASTARPVMVMSSAAIRDLHEDASSNAAAIYGSLIGERLHAATGGVNQGARPGFGSIDIQETAGVVAGDTTGKANFITLVGGQADSALIVPIGKGLTPEVERVASRIGAWLVFSFEFGAGIVDQNRCRRFITRA